MRSALTKPLIFAAATILVLSLAQTVVASIPAEVILNKSLLLNFRGQVERISITNPAIADMVLISPQQAQINGTAIGETAVIVWEKGGDKPAVFDLKVVGDQNAIETGLKGLPQQEGITVQYARDTAILSGKTMNEKTRERAEQIARIYAPKVINNIRIDDPQQVLLQVKVAQVDKTALKRLGISVMVKGSSAEGFTNMAGAPTGGSTTSTSTSSGGTQIQTDTKGTGIAGNIPGLGAFNPLDPFQMGVSYFPAGIGAVIQALATKNLARLLAEPNLLVKSGEKGNFHAGSKIPYSVVTSTGGTATTSVVFVDVGIKLGFAPEVLENGLISLKIDPAEVSSITGTLNVNGYPIIDIREVRTSVELKDGESLVLAGLLHEEAVRTMSKIPILGDIPILGALFRGTENDLKEKELVFFITPKITKPLAPGTKIELPTDHSPSPEQQKELNWIP